MTCWEDPRLRASWLVVNQVVAHTHPRRRLNNWSRLQLDDWMEGWMTEWLDGWLDGDVDNDDDGSWVGRMAVRCWMVALTGTKSSDSNWAMAWGERIRAEPELQPKGSVWNPIWLMANGVGRKINLFRGTFAVAKPKGKLGKLASIFHSNSGECGPATSSSSESRLWVGKRVFHSGSATVFFSFFFFWRLADTLASFSSLPAGTPSFSTCCAVCVGLVFLIFLQQDRKCNAFPGELFQGVALPWLNRVCRGHLCCLFRGWVPHLP